MMRRAFGVLVLLSIATAVTPAEANCARPIGYDARVSGSTVEIEPVNFTGRACPDPGGMLRQNVASGAVVRIADACKEQSYVDECVPPGHYRYGFAKPYECHASACSTDYFVEVSVEQPVSAQCARRPDDPGPTAAASVPWGSDATLCSYGGVPRGIRLIGPLVILGLLVIGGIGAAVMIRRRRVRA